MDGLSMHVPFGTSEAAPDHSTIRGYYIAFNPFLTPVTATELTLDFAGN